MNDLDLSLDALRNASEVLQRVGGVLENACRESTPPDIGSTEMSIALSGLQAALRHAAQASRQRTESSARGARATHEGFNALDARLASAVQP